VIYYFANYCRGRVPPRPVKCKYIFRAVMEPCPYTFIINNTSYCPSHMSHIHNHMDFLHLLFPFLC